MLDKEIVIIDKNVIKIGYENKNSLSHGRQKEH